MNFQNFKLLLSFWTHVVVDEGEGQSLKEMAASLLFSVAVWIGNLPKWFADVNIDVKPVGDVFQRSGKRIRKFEIDISITFFSSLIQKLNSIEPLMVKDTSISKIIGKIIEPLMVKDTSISGAVQSVLLTVLKWMVNSPEGFVLKGISLVSLKDEEGTDMNTPPLDLSDQQEAA